MQEFEFNPPE